MSSYGIMQGDLENSNLEPDGAEFLKRLSVVGEHLRRYIDSIDEMPTRNHPLPADYQRAGATRRNHAPEGGEELDSILSQFFERRVPYGFNSSHGGYLAFIPGGGIPDAALADLISDIVNRFVGLRQAAPLLAAIDEEVIDWFCSWMGYPENSSGGYLSTGGSLSNLAAIIAARHHHLGDDFSKGTIYTSDQAHHSIAKAAMHAGFNASHVRSIPTNATGQIDLHVARRLIEDDRSAGLEPFMLVSHAGTTNSGAVDNLTGSRDLARAQGLWWHVDAAYGGYFVLTQRGQGVLKGISDSDSVTLDPHKSLFLPYGTGCLLVRDLRRLQRAFSMRGEYMPPVDPNARHFDACDLSPELSRDFRGLRIWLPIKMHGLNAFRQSLDEKIDLAHDAWETIESWRRSGEPWECFDQPELSLFAFRLAPTGLSSSETDALNQELLEEVNRQNDVFLSPTRIKEKDYLRLCILSFRTHRKHVDRALMVLREAAQALLTSPSSAKHH